MRVLTLVVLAAAAAIASPALADDSNGSSKNLLFFKEKPAKSSVITQQKKVSDANPGIDRFKTASIDEVTPADEPRARGRKSKRSLMWPTGLAF